jgi:hypothetical protein
MRLAVHPVPLFPCLALLALACAAQRGAIEGSVVVVGNEPFTSVAIRTSEGTVYRVSASRALERRLRRAQGMKIIAEYTQIDSTVEGLKMVVTKFKTLEH